MNFGSLFSGIGGIDLGLERAGMECRWQVEIDPYCMRVLAKHWPSVPKYGDIKELTGAELERVDLICGGFPCQDVSLAGNRAGLAGERSGLWFEYARLLRVLRPRYVFVENVPGLLSSGMGQVLGDLAGLGYDAEWESLPAAAFGAPHIRERVLLVAYRHHPSQPVLSIDGKKWNRMQTRNSREAWLLQEPRVGGMADGLSADMDRLRGLGNAVVPQVAEYIGRQIIEFDDRGQPPERQPQSHSCNGRRMGTLRAIAPVRAAVAGQTKTHRRLRREMIVEEWT